MENVFLIDWLTFTVKGSTVDNVKGLIGLPDSLLQGSSKWEELGGCNGYPKSEMYNGIRIMYGASDEMGICVNMSGQGCRSFESFGAGDWMQLFNFLMDPAYAELVNITRIDLAYDDHTGVLDMHRIWADTHSGYLTMKFRKAHPEGDLDSDGNRLSASIYYGSPSSDIRVRIYDKASERGLTDVHWIRVELQLRRINATTAVQHLHMGLPMSTVVTGVLRNYLVFRDPPGFDDKGKPFDSNKSRWDVADYWEEFLDNAAPLTLWVNPGCEYNLSKLQRFVIDQAGNAISCYVMIHGYDGLRYFLDQYKKAANLPAKYKILLDLAARGDGGFIYDEVSENS